MGWQAIETAPRDTPILVWDGEGFGVAIGSRYMAGREEAYMEGTMDGDYDWAQVPHWALWMPLPDPPSK